MSRVATRHDSLYHAPILIRLWHLASLDAPTIALVWSLAFACSAHVTFPWWVSVLLPLGVWSVYIADRLLDARAGIHAANCNSLRERHLFHWRHRRVLVPVALAAALCAAWIVVQLMPRTIREHDSLLAAASLLYFTRVHTAHKLFPLLSKEFVVGVLFTLGCALPAWSRASYMSRSIGWPFIVATLCFALLAWLNCYAIDRWESGDALRGRRPFAWFALPLTAASILCAMLLASSNPRSAGLLICSAISALLLVLLDRSQRRLTAVTLRAAADLVLLTPLLLFPLALICK